MSVLAALDETKPRRTSVLAALDETSPRRGGVGAALAGLGRAVAGTPLAAARVLLEGGLPPEARGRLVTEHLEDVLAAREGDEAAAERLLSRELVAGAVTAPLVPARGLSGIGKGVADFAAGALGGGAMAATSGRDVLPSAGLSGAFSALLPPAARLAVRGMPLGVPELAPALGRGAAEALETAGTVAARPAAAVAGQKLAGEVRAPPHILDIVEKFRAEGLHAAAVRRLAVQRRMDPEELVRLVEKPELSTLDLATALNRHGLSSRELAALRAGVQSSRAASTVETAAGVVARPAAAQQSLAAGAAAQAGGDTPLSRVIDAIRRAPRVRGAQTRLQRAERARRFKLARGVAARTAGVAGFRQELSRLGGQLPKVEFERPVVSAEDITALMEQIKRAPGLDYLETLQARRGFQRLFGELGGGVPQKREIELLNAVFGQDFTKAVLEKRGLAPKLAEFVIKSGSVMQATLATDDLSAPLRQGALLVGRPREFAAAFRDMFRFALSGNAYKALNQSIVARPTYPLMKRAGLALTEVGPILSRREESLIANIQGLPFVPRAAFGAAIGGTAGALRAEIEGEPLAPSIARGAAFGVAGAAAAPASARAFTGFLNKLRADVFDDIVRNAARTGVEMTPDRARQIATFVNHASGRGTIKAMERAMLPLSAILWSPRLLASRLTLLNPIYYARLDPFVRKEALKTALASASVALTVLGLAKLAGSEDVEPDPASSDFAKLRVGNTRFDILGGFQQPIVAAARIITGRTKSPTTERERKLGEGYNATTRLDVAGRFARSKLSPAAGFVIDMMSGQDFAGMPLDVRKAILDRTVPLAAQDMVEVIEEWGPEGAPLGIPAIFGVGVQTFDRESRPRQRPAP